MTDIKLYILPGESRSKDRIFPVEMLNIEHYQPFKDFNLSEEDRKYRPAALKVTVQGEETRTYPFVLPCLFRPEWTCLDIAAQDMGFDLCVSEPVQDDDEIGRSVIRVWFATADGAVYTARQSTASTMLITELWPIRLDATWIGRQIEAANVARPRSHI